MGPFHSCARLKAVRGRTVCARRRAIHDTSHDQHGPECTSFIVITFGLAGGQLVPAALGAGLAGIVVLGIGAAVRRPLARLPENQKKFGVGLMLVSFGTYWAGEGIGIDWIGSDMAIVLLVAGYFLTSLLAVRTIAARLIWSGQPSSTRTLQESR